jgi:hypothetical protein
MSIKTASVEHGPGKYDDACTIARLLCDGRAAFLLILNGCKGSGFAVQCPKEIIPFVSGLLRTIADEIDRDQQSFTIIDDLAKRQTDPKK